MFNDFFETWKNVNDAMKLPSKWREIVFYSEGPWLTKHFRPIIEELSNNRDKNITLFTSSKIDNIDLEKTQNLKIFFIGNHSARTYLFRKFYAKLMIMSTPDLQSMQLKREKATIYYFLHHSPCSTHMIYQEDAFDHFDGMFCIGPYHENEVLERERKRSLRRKKLLKSGYPYFDNLKKLSSNLNNDSNILIAPSWGENSIVNLCLFELVNKLIDLKQNIILRPHNRSYIKNKKELLKVINHFKENKFFSLDNDSDSAISMNKSKILITDWSGISFEYMIQKKPILFIDVPPKVNNKNYKEYSYLPIEITMRDEIGEKIKLEEINNLNLSKLENTVSKATSKIFNNEKFVSENFYNYGNSVKVICDQIEQIR